MLATSLGVQEFGLDSVRPSGNGALVRTYHRKR